MAQVINGFRLADWATPADIAYAKSHSINVNQSAASQNWGANSPAKPAVAPAIAAAPQPTLAPNGVINSMANVFTGVPGGRFTGGSAPVQTSLQSLNFMPTSPVTTSLRSVNTMPAVRTGTATARNQLTASQLNALPQNPAAPRTNTSGYTGGHPSFASPVAPQNRLTMADYNATQRFIDEANQGRWMGLITPNMLLASGGALTPDLLSMNGYTQNTNGSWTRNNPIDNTFGGGGGGGGSGGGGGGYGGGGYGGGGGGANASDMINWRIGF